MNEIVVFYPEGHQRHIYPGHPERPERVEAIRSSLELTGIWEKVKKTKPHTLPLDLLESVHSSQYLQQLQKAAAASQSLDLDTYTTEDSWQLALNAAGGGVAIAEAVWTGKVQYGFGLTRPPGHHATSNRGMGFCLLNNIAIAAEYLVQEMGAKSLIIIDLDLHHGNGTQDIFYHRADVSYLSIHQSPFYPGTGKIQERGQGPGEGSILNIPLIAGAGDTAYLTITDEVIMPFLDQIKPEMVLVSYGFDIHWRDPLGGMLVTADGYYQLIQKIRRWADQHCQGRVALFLEGGYDLDAAGGCTVGAFRALMDQQFIDQIGSSNQPEPEQWKDTIQQVLTSIGS